MVCLGFSTLERHSFSAIQHLRNLQFRLWALLKRVILILSSWNIHGRRNVNFWRKHSLVKIDKKICLMINRFKRRFCPFSPETASSNRSSNSLCYSAINISKKGIISVLRYHSLLLEPCEEISSLLWNTYLWLWRCDVLQEFRKTWNYATLHCDLVHSH